MPGNGTMLKVSCPRDGDVIIDPAKALVVMDYEAAVYRFTCTHCNLPVIKPLDDAIIGLLRQVGIPNVDEVCAVWMAILDKDENIWRGLLTS